MTKQEVYGQYLTCLPHLPLSVALLVSHPLLLAIDFLLPSVLPFSPSHPPFPPASFKNQPFSSRSSISSPWCNNEVNTALWLVLWLPNTSNCIVMLSKAIYWVCHVMYTLTTQEGCGLLSPLSHIPPTLQLQAPSTLLCFSVTVYCCCVSACRPHYSRVFKRLKRRRLEMPLAPFQFEKLQGGVVVPTETCICFLVASCQSWLDYEWRKSFVNTYCEKQFHLEVGSRKEIPALLFSIVFSRS